MTDTAFTNARKCSKCGWEWIRKGRSQYDGHTVFNCAVCGTVKCDLVNDTEPKQCPRCRTKMWTREQKDVNHE